MAATDPTTLNKVQKWWLLIVTIGGAIYEAVKYLIAHWPS